MSKLPITSESRVTYDPQAEAVRTWFDTTTEPMTKDPLKPRDVAYEVLRDSSDLFKWQRGLRDLRDGAVLNSEKAYSVRFTQEYNDIPVDASEIVVNMYADGRDNSVYNNYHYDIPKDLDPNEIKYDTAYARELVARLLESYER